MTVKRWLAFLLAAGIFLAVHEGLHALTATLYGEYQAFHIRPFGFEVEFRTPVEAREGIRWAVMSGISNVVTVLRCKWLCCRAWRQSAGCADRFLRHLHTQSGVDCPQAVTHIRRAS